MSFAAIEDRVNQATLAAFSNRESVTVNGVTLSRAVFDADYVDVMDVEASGPAVSCLSAEATAAAVAHDSPVIINGVQAYKVVEIKPDGTGVTVLRLHKA